MPNKKFTFSKTQSLEFSDKHLILNEQTILFSEIEGLSYLLTKVDGPSDNLRAEIRIKTAQKEHRLVALSRSQRLPSLRALLGKEDPARLHFKEEFSQAVAYLQTFVKPGLVKHLVTKIEKEGSIQMADLKITNNTIERTRLFRKPQVIAIKDGITCSLYGEKLTLYTGFGENQKEWMRCSVQSLNAVAFIDVLNALTGQHSARTAA